jgi:hypothetical protein
MIIYDPIECPGCLGSGVIEIGDVEDGVLEDCPACDGTGEMEGEEI